MNKEDITNKLKTVKPDLYNDYLSGMDKNEIEYFEGIKEDFKELKSLYRFRLQLTKENSNYKIEEQDIESWQNAMIDLDGCCFDIIGLCILKTKKKAIFLFYDDESSKVITAFVLSRKIDIT